MCNARRHRGSLVVPCLLYLSFLVSGLPGYVHAQESPAEGTRRVALASINKATLPGQSRY